MIQLLLVVIYISFISLGLPDAILGAAWPTMYPQLEVPVSYAGVVSMIISLGTVTSSLFSDRLSRKLGTGKVTAISVALTAAALLGFSVSNSFWMLCLLAIPYGLGAGSVDACLNNYVAIHYESRHMSWLHCMWGLGATTGPYIMGWFLTTGQSWSLGYRTVGLIQVALTAVLIFSLPLWQTGAAAKAEAAKSKPLTLPQIFAIPGAKEVMVTFFCYCALESTAMLWASSYLSLGRGIPAEAAASYAGLFFIGMTVGRALSGFLTMKFSDTELIRMGAVLIGLGCIAMVLPLGELGALGGLVIMGLGCAPIYPCIMHSIPVHFGPERSQAIIGVQMASAYVGSLSMPPLFGLIANHITSLLLPWFVFVILIGMAVMHQRLVRLTK